MEAVEIRIKGDVQGVSFRYWAQRAAKKAGVIGWAKNEHDGSVTIFAQGNPEGIKKITEWASEGSPMSTVEVIEVKNAEPLPGHKGFQIK